MRSFRTGASHVAHLLRCQQVGNMMRMDVVHHNSTLKLQHQKISSTSYGELIEYNGSSSSSSFRPLKLQRESAINEDQTANMESRRAAIIASLRKFQQESESSERDVSAMITDLRKLTRD
ncbi:Uncharacterized protein Fot_22030 [Forsythia ovata]|uniref:Uncharacterized protein n=1 Tax=Forsythia ovata TaxID=205694 RepID=A0ABD1UWM4_9LAMI